jgi:protoporphyrinogen oxidase
MREKKMSDPALNNIVVLGAGISGLTAAYELSKIYRDRVIVVEKEKYTGGLAATLHFNRLSVDIGSHRVQSTVNMKIRSYISDSLGIELLKRPRRGLLYMQGMALKYPPSISNLVRSLPLKTSFYYLLSLADRFKYPHDTSNYKSAMLHSVGRRIYENYYEDYVYKLWGIAPEHIAVEGMKRRKTILDMKSLLKNITGRNNYFYYPRDGMGAIAKKLIEKIVHNGGKIYSDAQISSIKVDGSNRISSLSLVDDLRHELSFVFPLVLSTIPIDDVHAYIYPRRIAPKLNWRELRIVYLHVSEDIHVAHETFYFPKRETPCGRISFIKKYSPYLNSDARGTIITFEFPSSIGDTIWEMDNQLLCRICVQALKTAGIVVQDLRIKDIYSISIKKAYPIYTTDWKQTYQCYLKSMKAVDNLFIFGRRGLFLHCNIDHAVKQGLEVAKTICRHPQQPSRHWNEIAESFTTCCARD